MCKICDKYRSKETRTLDSVCGKPLYGKAHSQTMLFPYTYTRRAEFLDSILKEIVADPSIVSTDPSDIVLRKNLEGGYYLCSGKDKSEALTKELTEDDLMYMYQIKSPWLKALAISFKSEALPTVYLIKDRYV